MVTETTSFRTWLSDLVREVLSRKLPHPPFPVPVRSGERLERAATRDGRDDRFRGLGRGAEGHPHFVGARKRMAPACIWTGFLA